MIGYTAISLSDTGPSTAHASESPWGTRIRDIWGVGYKCKFLIFTQIPLSITQKGMGAGGTAAFLIRLSE